MVKIGILDQVPLQEGISVPEAVQHTIELVKKAEVWGYNRYWFAEHHGTNGLLSAAPELWIGRAGAETSTIILGAGGILLPQYSPLKTAETFSTLAAFYPGRIELGVGRSPGGSERTRQALTDGAEKNFQAFPQQLDDTAGFLHDSLSLKHPYRIVKKTPRQAPIPPMWLLGLSPESGKLAGERGMGLVFGYFINPDRAEETIASYRESCAEAGFEPRIIICIFAVCAETEEEAERLAVIQDHWLAGVPKGNTIVPSPESIAEKRVSDEEKARMHHERRRVIAGSPEKIKKELKKLQRLFGTDEFLLINNTHGPKARESSFKLIAEAVLEDK
ncbi:LLM class flavin-dependent oxidoreductase [Alkalicoccus halolimnae]|uniref:LLM class flavin-dependent oxidoreductase n=1 Tax=Alkalicoccus halolimnae TaxID=1667239 RepID=A0AAJ8LWD7_9BACI